MKFVTPRSRNFLMAMALGLSSMSVAATDPPCLYPCTVVIVGKYGDSGGGSGTYTGQTGPSIYMDSIYQDQAALKEPFLTDIRCALGNVTTTSKNKEDKEAAARLMYQQNLSGGAGVAPGGTYTVTWADGGTSTYQVLNNSPGASNNHFLANAPVRETFGDGIAKAGGSCERA